jgi:hypothetical protein
MGIFRNASFRTGAAALAAMVASASLGVASASPGMAGRAGTNAAHVRTADGDSMTSLVSGRVTDESGDPAKETPILLYAWPSNEVTKDLAVGDQATMQMLADTTTDAEGRFSLDLAVDATLEPLAGQDRMVNFTVLAGDGTSIAPYSFARTLHSTNGTYTLSEVGEGAVPSDVAPSPAETVQVNLSLNGSGSDQYSTEAEATSYDDLPPEQAVPFQKGCGAYLQQDLGARWVIVGQHYAITDMVQVNFTYRAGSSSALGVGWSLNGEYGGFKLSGTNAKASYSEIGFAPAGHWARGVRRTAFRYGKFFHYCVGQAGAAVHWYEVRAINHVGGAQSIYGSWYPDANYCLPYEARSGQKLERTLSLEWSAGADVSAAIGMDLSARTGYSTVTTTHYIIGPLQRRLCGKYAYPSEAGQSGSGTRAPRVVVAKG